MRSFYLLLATLLASPLISARTIQVDSKKLEALEKAFAEFQSSIKGRSSSSSSSNTPTFDPSAPTVVVDTEEDPIGSVGSSGSNSRTPSVVVDTVEDSLDGRGTAISSLGGTNFGAADVGKCVNAGTNCNKFQNFPACWQFCVASKSTVNPRSGDCAAWCVENCGCDKPANLAMGLGTQSNGFTTSATATGATPTPGDIVFGPGQGTTNFRAKPQPRRN